MNASIRLPAGDESAALPATSKPPRVLVLLAARNGASWIAAQIDSILVQCDVQVRLLVSDDASTDGTARLVLTTYGKDSRVSVLTHTSASGSAAANFRQLITTADATDFECVAFADQDDVWLPQKLSRACQALTEGQYAGYSASVFVGARESDRVRGQCPDPTPADFLFEGAGQGCTFVLQAAFFRRLQTFVRSHTREVEGFHFHDWMVYLLCRAWGLRWCFDPRPSMWYRQHAGNEIGARGGWSAMRRRLDLIRSGWYAAQVLHAAHLYEIAGGRAATALRLIALLRSRHRAARRLLLAASALFRSRRRLGDRLVVAAAALGGLL